jgi:hypothetical protein
MTKLETPEVFDPDVGAAELGVELEISALPPGSFTLAVDFEILQGGGIPVRTITARREVALAGSFRLASAWDGLDRSGQRAHDDGYEVLVHATLSRRSEPDVVFAELGPTRGISPLDCQSEALCALVRACSGALGDPEHCTAPLADSRYLCSVLGGFAGPEPQSSWNFKGTGPLGPIRLPFATVPSDRYPANAPPGGNPANSENPIVVGTDLGSPFEHVRSDGTKRLLFLFGDTAPLAERAYMHDAKGKLFPTGSPFDVYPANDDVLAESGQSADDPPTGPDRCLDLRFERGGPDIDPVQGLPEGDLIEPMTMDGPFRLDASGVVQGIDLGYTRVPGPGFSIDGQAFAMMPADNDLSIGISCDAKTPCAGTDTCLYGICFYGDCSALDGSTPCFKRHAPATLAKSDAGDGKFRSLLASERAPGALDVYVGRADIIPPVAFYVPDDGQIFVWGREQIVGHPSAPAELRFWKHPYTKSAGIGVPEFFAGCDDDPRVCDAPRFSPKQGDAVPVYAEDRLIANQTSVTWLPSFGAWVMIYGGRLPLWTRSRYPSLSEARALDPYTGIVLRTAKHPWGPWSSALTIYDPYWSNVDGYCELLFRTDKQAEVLDERVGPGFAEATCDPESVVQRNHTRLPDEFGAEYGAAIVSRFTVDGADEAVIDWLLSTWNPYRVVLMQTRLRRPSP